MTVKKIEKQLLKLDARSRARRLLHSLEELTDAENERLWAEEAVRRHNELSRRQTRTRPADEVLREARLRLK